MKQLECDPSPIIIKLMMNQLYFVLLNVTPVIIGFVYWNSEKHINES